MVFLDESRPRFPREAVLLPGCDDDFVERKEIFFNLVGKITELDLAILEELISRSEASRR